MADLGTIVDQQTVITTPYNQDVNNVIYRILGSSTGAGGAAPTTAAQVLANLGMPAYLASPPTIGGTAPAPITGTTITPTVGITGITSGSSAPAGDVGEFISSTQAVSLSLTTSVITNVTTITLTAGDWDVSGNVFFQVQAGGAANQFFGGISGTSVTFPPMPGYSALSTTGAANSVFSFVVPSMRVNITTNTTYYLVAESVFTGGVGQVTVGGNLTARRRR